MVTGSTSSNEKTKNQARVLDSYKYGSVAEIVEK
jgi:hypothetical protein